VLAPKYGMSVVQVADLGDTANSSTTLEHLAASKPAVVLMIGGYCNRRSSWPIWTMAAWRQWFSQVLLFC
jgi:hypothetical protein